MPPACVRWNSSLPPRRFCIHGPPGLGWRGRLYPRGRMQLPFSYQELEQLLINYNEAVWPAQWGLYAIALAVVLMPFLSRRSSPGALLWPLGALWAWTGVVYLGFFLPRINPAAPVLALLFCVQAIMLWRRGWRERVLVYQRGGWRPRASLLLGLLALLVYPVWHQQLDSGWPSSITAGLPLPTVMVTVAVLTMWSSDNLRGLLVIPLLWVLVGVATALELALWPDLVLLAAAVVAIRLIVPARPSGRLT